MPKITRSEKNKKKHKEITNEKIKNKSNFIIRFLIILALIITLIVIYARYTETSGLIVNEYKIENEKIPNNFHGIKIVQLSDIHYGTTVNMSYLKYIVNKINILKPDIVLFTGDLVYENYPLDNDDIKDITSILNNIDSSISKYACIGNEDYSNDQYNIIMKNSNFNIINNNYERVYYKDNNYIIINSIGSDLENDMDLNKAFSFEEKDKFVITMTHESDSVKDILEYQTDMIISGHSLGGLIRIPFLNGLFFENGSNYYNKRIEKIKDTYIFNSYGIGTNQIKFRLFNKPSINLYRLTKK